MLKFYPSLNIVIIINIKKDISLYHGYDGGIDKEDRKQFCKKLKAMLL